MLSLKDATLQIQSLMDTVMRYQRRRSLFTRLGRVMKTDTGMNFRHQQSPDGEPWEPLKLRQGRILSDTGRLRNSIHFEADDDQVVIGTNVKYAPVHQFGAVIKPVKKQVLAFPDGRGGTAFARQVTIPARPFIGIEERQINLIHDAMTQWLRDITRGRRNA